MGVNERFSRQVALDGFGSSGQATLLGSSVLVLGLGGVGSICAVYLGRSGVGRLGLADYDTVDESNLNRQVFYTEANLGGFKADVLAEKIRCDCRWAEVTSIKARVDAAVLENLVAEYDLVVDAIDSLPVKLQVNQVCVGTNTPLVTAGASHYYGQVLAVASSSGPCLSCLVNDSRPQPDEAPTSVLGPLAAILGCIEATEALKLLLDIGTSLAGKVLCINTKTWRTYLLPLARRAECPVCGQVTG
jgi:molybdopterin/thiamine biosynthesis adenylyltransferase